MVKTRFILAGVLLSLAVAPAFAQGPGGPGGPGGGAMPPQMQKFMEQTKYKRQLRNQFRAIEELNRDPSTAVTPSQANKLLAIIKPWTSRDKMTEEQARGLILQVKKVMTPRQLTAMGNFRPRGFGGGGGGFGRPGGGPGGPGGPGAARPPFDPSRLAAMKNANWLSTKVDPSNPRSQLRAESNQRMIAELEARAHGNTARARR